MSPAHSKSRLESDPRARTATRRSLLPGLRHLRRTFCQTALLASLVLPPAAHAGDPRLDDTPTSWWHLYGATATQIGDLLTNEGARLVDFEVQTTNPYTFTASFVRNSGSYAVSGWWWYYNATVTDITNLLNTNQARLIDLRRYSVNGEDRFTCVMVSNTGAESKTWWWYVGATVSQVSSLLTANNARLVSVSSYMSGGTTYYDVVMIRNTGADQLTWWWYVDATGSQLTSLLNTNNARLYDFEIYTDAGVPKFNAIMTQNTGANSAVWWWYYNASVNSIVELANQNGARVFDIEAYVPNTTTLYGALMVNNSNALTTRIGSCLDYGTDGWTGAYLRNLAGSTLASLQPSFVFEPASTIKALIALHYMRGVQGGTETMGASHSQFTAMSGSCPLDATPVTESFRSSLYRMLKNSDNARTQFFRSRYGNEAINTTGSSVVGMLNTDLNHRLGCGDSAVARPNALTLADNALMYEKIFEATVLTPAWSETLRTYLVNENDHFPFQVNLEAIVDQETAAAGLDLVAENFKKNIHFAFKAGSYGLNCAGGCDYYYSIGGWLQLPSCGGPGPQYAFGTFIHGSTSDASASNRLWQCSAELFREQIRAQLLTCTVDVPLAGLPEAIEFAPPRPNPAAGRVTMTYALTRATGVRLTVFDLAGREVTRLVARIEGPGNHTTSWDLRGVDGNPVESGIYFARLEAAGAARTQKVVVER